MQHWGLNMKDKILKMAILFLLLVFVAAGAYAAPTFTIFKGNVRYNGADALVGTTIKAYIQGDDDSAAEDGSFTVSTRGAYGNLIVSGKEDFNGYSVKFKVNDLDAQQASTFSIMEIQTLDLTAKIGR